MFGAQLYEVPVADPLGWNAIAVPEVLKPMNLPAMASGVAEEE